MHHARHKPNEIIKTIVKLCNFVRGEGIIDFKGSMNRAPTIIFPYIGSVAPLSIEDEEGRGVRKML